MPAKRSKREVPPSSTRYGRVLIMLEEIREQNKATIEAVFATTAALEKKFESRFQQIETRLTALEAAVKLNSEDIKRNSAAIERNSEDIKRNSAAIERNSEDIKKHTEELVALRAAVTRLETRVSQVDQKLAIEGLDRRLKAVEERLGM